VGLAPPEVAHAVGLSSDCSSGGKVVPQPLRGGLADVELLAESADRGDTISCQFSRAHYSRALPERIGHGRAVIREGAAAEALGVIAQLPQRPPVNPNSGLTSDRIGPQPGLCAGLGSEANVRDSLALPVSDQF
jgi:hypothetical protein